MECERHAGEHGHAPGSSGIFLEIGQMTPQQRPHQPDALADCLGLHPLYCGKITPAGGQGTLHPVHGDIGDAIRYGRLVQDILRIQSMVMFPV